MEGGGLPTLTSCCAGGEGDGGSKLLLEYGVTLMILTDINQYLTDRNKLLVFSIGKYQLCISQYLLNIGRHYFIHKNA